MKQYIPGSRGSNSQLRTASQEKQSLAQTLFLVIAVVGALWLLLPLVSYFFAPMMLAEDPGSAIGIIGGADGPTAIFVSESGISILSLLWQPAVVTVVGTAGYVILRRRNSSKKK